MRRLLFLLLAFFFITNFQVFISGCGQIMAPTGGPRDSIPPKLVTASPKPGTINFTGNRIVLYFDEFVQVDQLQQNLLVSPSPKNIPNIDAKLRTVSIKLRDTLEKNTTYTINFGDAIRDLNEANILKNFSYVFSTGPVIDSMEFSGNVLVAETGKTDSTLIVLLYKNLSDSAVQKLKPNYIARLTGSGNFTFHNLAPGVYKVYSLKDQDGSHIYNDKRKLFAFADTTILVNDNTGKVTLYAYSEQKDKIVDKVGASEKKLKYTSRIQTERQDLLSDMIITFNKPLKNFDNERIKLTDTLYTADADSKIIIDSTARRVIIQKAWKENEDYRLIISKELSDTSGNKLTKSDTIRFKTRKEDDYGSLKLNFPALTNFKNPVLQFLSSNEIVLSSPLTSSQWFQKLILPGEYELRILNDENKNGTWDPGNFAKKKQPEKAVSISKRISVRGGGWENEVDISL